MKQTTCFLIIALVLMGNPLLAQTVQNTDPSAILEVNSTTRGFLPPRMSADQRDAIPSPATGLTIYNLDSNTLEVFTGLEWDELGDSNAVIVPSGKIWMDRNLGASQVATSSTDSDAYGWLFQWGRNADGHQERTSSTAAGPVAAGDEGSSFITTTGWDWLSAPDNTRWNGATKGAHDPCPGDFRVPTEAELDYERSLFSPLNWLGAFNSALKLTLAGYRYYETGGISKEGESSYYWTSTTNGGLARILHFGASNTARMSNGQRGFGFSVRCVKDQ